MQRIMTRIRDAMLPAAARMRHRAWQATDDTILVLQPDHLGDIILSQPAVQHLRDTNPDSTLVAVVGPWSREIASTAWPVDAVVTVPFPGFTRAAGASVLSPYRQLRVEAQRLRSYHARAAYVLRPDAWWTAWLASLISPFVVTSDDARTRQFATEVVTLSSEEHAVLRALRIAAGHDSTLPELTEPTLRLPSSAAASGEADRLLQERRVSLPYFVIHPGAGAVVKEWPVHRWQEVAGDLASQGWPIVLTGSQAEADVCTTIANRVPACVSLAGLTTVPVLAEVMRGAAIAIGPDCGPLHLAVATGTPTVHLFGPSDPCRYGPWGDPNRHRVVTANWHCSRCGDLSPGRGPACGCMLAIQTDAVLAAAKSVLRAHVE